MLVEVADGMLVEEGKGVLVFVPDRNGVGVIGGAPKGVIVGVEVAAAPDWWSISDCKVGVADGKLINEPATGGAVVTVAERSLEPVLTDCCASG